MEVKGEIMILLSKYVLSGTMDQPFLWANLSVYLNMNCQSLVPSHCWDRVLRGWHLWMNEPWAQAWSTLGLSGWCQSGPGLKKAPRNNPGEPHGDWVSPTAHTLCLWVISIGSTWERHFVWNLIFRLQVHKQKLMLWSLNIIIFNLAVNSSPSLPPFFWVPGPLHNLQNT